MVRLQGGLYFPLLSKQVEFEGSITSLSDAARTMLHRHGGKLTAAHGPRYWIYKSETLTELRFRMEDD
jgi:hypothetical protein